MGIVDTAPRGLLYLFGERYAWHARRVCSPRAKVLLAASTRSHSRCSRPHATRGPSPWLDITPSMATSSSTSNYCLKTWPPRFGRFHLLLVMYTMDMEPLSSRRLLLSVGHGAATSTPGATALYLPADSSWRCLGWLGTFLKIEGRVGNFCKTGSQKQQLIKLWSEGDSLRPSRGSHACLTRSTGA